MLLSRYMKNQEKKVKKPTEAEDELESANEEETKKEERTVGRLLNGIRNKMVERGLVGNISINRQSGVFLSNAACHVHACDVAATLGDENEMSPSDVKALNMADGVFKNLMKRSAYWDGFAYSPDLELGRGFEVGFYVPLFLSLGFIISVNITATVLSLTAYRKKLEKKKQFVEALSLANAQMVSEVHHQGVGLVQAQKAVIATKSVSVEAALAWAITPGNDQFQY